MSKTLFAMIILFVALLGGFFFIKKEYGSELILQSSSQPSPTPSVTTILSFAPNELTITPGTISQADIRLESVGASPSLVQLEIAYDPLALSIVSVVPGDYFTQPTIILENNNAHTGRLSYALESANANLKARTKGIIATIYFTPLLPSWQKDSAIYFLPKTSIKTHEGRNIFTAGYGVTILKPTFSVPAASQAAY